MRKEEGRGERQEGILATKGTKGTKGTSGVQLAIASSKAQKARTGGWVDERGTHLGGGAEAGSGVVFSRLASPFSPFWV